MVRKERKSEKREMAELVGSAETSNELEAKKLKTNKTPKRVASVPQREQLASTPKRLLPKGKEPSL